MLKSVIILYLVVFSTYIYFSRQPDYLDGEFAEAKIHYSQDKKQMIALFVLNSSPIIINADYIFRSYKEGEIVTVIYENTEPQKAKIYSWWGYWITSSELIFSVILLTASYFVAHSITQNPTPEALTEQLDYEPEHKKKYDM